MKIKKDDILNFKMPSDFRMKLAKNKVRCRIYKVSYTYVTNRGNSRENNIYLASYGNINAEKEFLEYIEYLNIKKPYRAISNVKILDIELMGDMEIVEQGKRFRFELPDDFQKKFIHKKVDFNVYKISYEKITKYKNTKLSHMYMVLDKHLNPKIDFGIYLDICYSKKTHTAVSNVKILDIEKLGVIAR